MTAEERVSQWREIIEKQKASGLSGAAYCREHGINLSRFYHWRKRFNQESHGGFLELKADPAPAGSGVLIHLNGTLCIELAPGFHMATLQRAVHALSDRLPCFP